MELLSFDCTRCDERVTWAHPRKVDMAKAIRRSKDAGWIVNLDEPTLETRFGEVDVSFAGVCPDCRFLDYTVESSGDCNK